MSRRSWTEVELRDAVQKSTSIRQVLGWLNLQKAGGNYQQIQKYIEELGLSTLHFKGKSWNKGNTGKGIPRIKLADILVQNSLYQSFKLKRRLFKVGLKKPECELCGWNKKADDRRIPVELDHVNGIKTDNRLENLRILCPNCHSLQSTHRGLNQKRKKG